MNPQWRDEIMTEERLTGLGSGIVSTQPFSETSLRLANIFHAAAQALTSTSSRTKLAAIATSLQVEFSHRDHFSSFILQNAQTCLPKGRLTNKNQELSFHSSDLRLWWENRDLVAPRQHIWPPETGSSSDLKNK